MVAKRNGSARADNLVLDPNEDPFTSAPAGRIVHGLSLEDYHADPTPSRSTLWDLWSTSPREFHEARQREARKPSRSMERGTRAHLAIIQPELVESSVALWSIDTIPGYAERLGIEPTPTAKKAIADGDRSKQIARSGNLWKAVEDELRAAGKLILSPDEEEYALALAQWARTRKGVRRVFADGMVEPSLYWHDPVVGLDLRIRPDFVLPNGDPVEIKQTYDLGPRGVMPWKLMRTARDQGYHVQLAMQVDGLRACGVDAKEGHVFWVAAKGTPHGRMTTLPESALEHGRRIYRAAARIYKVCTETDTWPDAPFEPSEHSRWLAAFEAGRLPEERMTREVLPWEEEVA